LILGSDPGLSGALAVYDPVRNNIVAAHNIPTLTIKRNGKQKNSVDIHRLIVIVKELAATYPGLRACLELVGAMPKQGVSSVFSFGRTDGAIETAVAAAGIPYQKVPPQTWKRVLACPADKDGALLRANQLMPESVPHWTPERHVRDKEDCKGIAEAALIAYYGATKIFT
jgi:crossover junction endodeoxyribonuclease RuvC